jgi:tRNA dimethylallyltransferase
MSSLGYQELGSALRGETTLEVAIERLKFHTHHYIRRQLTWFRAEARLVWLDCTATHLEREALALVEGWLAG